MLKDKSKTIIAVVANSFYCLIVAAALNSLFAKVALAQPSADNPRKTPHVPTTKNGAAPGGDQVPASATLLKGSVNAFGMACAWNGIVPLSTQIPTLVQDVKKGSPAFYGGVAAGDRILQATIENNQFNLKIERDGHVYLARLQAQMDRANLSGGSPQIVLAAALRTYQIRLIVDHSGSMYRPLGNSDKLRWTWVKEELEKFCDNVQKISGNTFDLYMFNETVQQSMTQSAKQVKATLANAVTTGNTDLPAALKAATLESPRPILIILVTDGQAVNSKENGQILATNLSRTANLRKSRIVFLQAGYSPEGSLFVASLNDALAARGMNRRTFTVLFEEASRRGILGTIEPLLTQ